MGLVFVVTKKVVILHFHKKSEYLGIVSKEAPLVGVTLTVAFAPKD